MGSLVSSLPGGGNAAAAKEWNLVCNWNDTRFTLTLPEDATMKLLKQKLSVLTGVPPSEQTLVGLTKDESGLADDGRAIASLSHLQPEFLLLGIPKERSHPAEVPEVTEQPPEEKKLSAAGPPSATDKLQTVLAEVDRLESSIHDLKQRISNQQNQETEDEVDANTPGEESETSLTKQEIEKRCALLEEELVRRLERLDSIETGGDPSLRKQRKAIVLRVQQAIEVVDSLDSLQYENAPQKVETAEQDQEREPHQQHGEQKEETPVQEDILDEQGTEEDKESEETEDELVEQRKEQKQGEVQ
ncbi:BCL2 associated athanogene 4 [Balamuthia mandrillaris]